MLNTIANMVKAMAEFGAGATSALSSYQPKTPACLMDDED
ncbi:MAG: cyclic lactone autoinducer peptide [Clostridia bacterium]|nr:cyclic lactone autoinducer peptide [Clostridia bacterium]